MFKWKLSPQELVRRIEQMRLEFWTELFLAFKRDADGRIVDDNKHNIRAMLEQNSVTVGHHGKRLLAWHPDCNCWNDLDSESLATLHRWARKICGWRPPRDVFDRLVLEEARRHLIKGKLAGEIGETRLGEW